MVIYGHILPYMDIYMAIYGHRNYIWRYIWPYIWPYMAIGIWMMFVGFVKYDSGKLFSVACRVKCHPLDSSTGTSKAPTWTKDTPQEA